MPFCTACGVELTSRSAICPNCGGKSKTETNDVRTAIIALGSVLGLAVVLYAGADRPKPSTVALSTNSISNTGQPVAAPVRTDEIYADASANAQCATRYPTDFSMQSACKRNADSGRGDFIDIWNKYLDNAAMNIALQNCFSRYTEVGLTDFAMAGACARNQEDGLNEVRR
jgi:hypothetical protein